MNNDLISRSALIENYGRFLARASIDPIIRAFMTSVMCTVDNAPAVDVVPMDFHERCMELEVKKRIAAEKTARQCIENYEPVRHGKWDAEYEYEDFIRAFCSVCGEESKYMYKFCPNCGAKMDGGTK